MKKNLILVLNCGSSSLKFSLIKPENGQTLLSGLAERLLSEQASSDEGAGIRGGGSSPFHHGYAGSARMTPASLSNSLTRLLKGESADAHPS